EVGRLRQSQVALVIAACSSTSEPPAPPPPPPHVPTVAELPRLRGISAIVDRFGALTATSCGVLDHVDNQDAAQVCITRALAAKQPFIMEELRSGEDSQYGRALVGVVETGTYVVYAASSDSDPCGG